MSPTELGAKVGVTHSAIQQLEVSAGEPKMRNGLRIALALGVSPAYLAFGAEVIAADGARDPLASLEARVRDLSALPGQVADLSSQVRSIAKQIRDLRSIGTPPRSRRTRESSS